MRRWSGLLPLRRRGVDGMQAETARDSFLGGLFL